MKIIRTVVIINQLWLALVTPAVCASSPFLNLVSVYEANDTDGLREVLREWQGRSVPLSDRERAFLPPSAQAAYEIYRKFLRSVGGTAQAGNRFVIQQKDLRITVRESLKRDAEDISRPYIDAPLFQYEIKNFRPRLAGYNLAALYLDDYTEGQIYSFLGTAPGPVKRHFSIRLDPAISREEQRKRFEFITRELVIHVGVWGDLILSSPRVTEINVDREMNYAVVSYAMRAGGGDLRFYKVEGVWKRQDDGPVQPTWRN
jgi:hypothetical protein